MQMTRNQATIAVALSGGVDSLTAGYLLQKQGFTVIGVHFVTGYESPSGAAANPDPVSAAAGRMGPLAERLGIRLHIEDVRAEFEHRVVRYFEATYRRGKTPNPCLVCNPTIKFQTVLEAARSLGAEKLATGHYARILRRPDGSVRLRRGIDRSKDQSYFLAFLTPAQLDRAVFPLGEMTKEEVKALARTEHLVPAATESQDVCFIRDGDYKKFLAERDPAGFKPGPIVDTAGNPIGEHRGLHRFTVGQRRGIDIPAAEPYYVVRLDPAHNRLVVGFKDALYAEGCRVEQAVWPGPPPAERFEAETRLRYRHRGVPSSVIPVPNGTEAAVAFCRPQAAVTPGQGAVFYQGDEVVGAGFID